MMSKPVFKVVSSVTHPQLLVSVLTLWELLKMIMWQNMAGAGEQYFPFPRNRSLIVVLRRLACTPQEVD